MKIVNTDRIKPDGGDYLVLADLGYEGLVVQSQHETLEDAITGLAKSDWSHNTLVKVVDVVCSLTPTPYWRHQPMSGPYCETCEHFARQPLTPRNQGECRDPSKIIYSGAGNAVNSHPEVFDKFTCVNWEQSTGDASE